MSRGGPTPRRGPILMGRPGPGSFAENDRERPRRSGHDQSRAHRQQDGGKHRQPADPRDPLVGRLGGREVHGRPPSPHAGAVRVADGIKNLVTMGRPPRHLRERASGSRVNGRGRVRSSRVSAGGRPRGLAARATPALPRGARGMPEAARAGLARSSRPRSRPAVRTPRGRGSVRPDRESRADRSTSASGPAWSGSRAASPRTGDPSRRRRSTDRSARPGAHRGHTRTRSPLARRGFRPEASGTPRPEPSSVAGERVSAWAPPAVRGAPPRGSGGKAGVWAIAHRGASRRILGAARPPQEHFDEIFLRGDMAPMGRPTENLVNSRARANFRSSPHRPVPALLGARRHPHPWRRSCLHFF